MKKRKINPIEVSGVIAVLRTSEAIKLGIHPAYLYKFRDEGALELLGQGIFRLVSMPDFLESDVVLAAKRIAHAVIFLTSDLAYYELTTQVPHFVYVALPRTVRLPQTSYPPLRCFWYSRDAYKEGIEIISIT